ncbi:MAG: ribonuclease Z [Nitrospirae bacterium]|nr:ribonuclease Z [Nitrospirota bacterium]
MKPTFHHRLVNNPFEDPCVHVRVLREKRAFLFDLGCISRLDPGDIQKITDVFVTHTHIDHFIGFDILLRSLLRREIPLRVFGPANIIGCIEGKLKGYTWNLISEYPLKIEAFGIEENIVRHSGFYAGNCFRRIDLGERPFDGIVLKETPFEIRAACLMHQIPCLGFSLNEEFHINVDKAVLVEMGLPVGPWLSEFKKVIRVGGSSDTEFIVKNRRYTLGELTPIANITKGQKMSYVADSSMNEENIRKVIELAKDSDTLYCEAYFLEEDRERAIERHHLTAKTAGRIAREAGVKSLVVMHFSPKYRECPDAPEKEAMMEYNKRE